MAIFLYTHIICKAFLLIRIVFFSTDLLFGSTSALCQTQFRHLFDNITSLFQLQEGLSVTQIMLCLVEVILSLVMSGFCCAAVCCGRKRNKQVGRIDSNKSHNASVPYQPMHHFVTEMCPCVDISVTKWCILGYLSNALWGLRDGSNQHAFTQVTLCRSGGHDLYDLRNRGCRHGWHPIVATSHWIFWRSARSMENAPKI